MQKNIDNKRGTDTLRHKRAGISSPEELDQIRFTKRVDSHNVHAYHLLGKQGEKEADAIKRLAAKGWNITADNSKTASKSRGSGLQFERKAFKPKETSK